MQLGLAATPLLQGRETDFEAYRGASRALAGGRDPYLNTVRPYLYPPLVAVALIPTLILPDVTARILWILISSALLTGCMAFLSRARSQEESLRIVGAGLLFAPFAATQWNGQVNGFLLALLLLARAHLEANRERNGGFFLGASLALKPIGLFVAAGLFLSARWRAVAWTAVVFVTSFLLVVPFLGWVGVVEAARHVARILSASWPESYPGNISLNGMLDRLFGAGSVLRHRLVALCLLGGTLILSIRARASSRGSAATVTVVAFDALLAATILGADSSWLHHSAILFPAAIALSNPLLASVVLLFGIAACWHRFLALAGAPGALAASAAGTLAVGILWAHSVIRLLGSSSWPSTPNFSKSSPAPPVTAVLP